MFHLNPASWCLESTLLNIQLIARKRRKGDTSEIKPEEHIMGFWIDYFSMATEKKLDDHILFPVSLCDIRVIPLSVFLENRVWVFLESATFPGVVIDDDIARGKL